MSSHWGVPHPSLTPQVILADGPSGAGKTRAGPEAHKRLSNSAFIHINVSAIVDDKWPKPQDGGEVDEALRQACAAAGTVLLARYVLQQLCDDYKGEDVTDPNILEAALNCLSKSLEITSLIVHLDEVNDAPWMTAGIIRVSCVHPCRFYGAVVDQLLL